MSDAAGLATGGVSAIMSLAEGGDSSACEIRPEASDFYFYLDPQDGEVEQCTQLGISWGDNATDPVTIVGVIPQGDAFILSTEDAVNSRSAYCPPCFPPPSNPPAGSPLVPDTRSSTLCNQTGTSTSPPGRPTS